MENLNSFDRKIEELSQDFENAVHDNGVNISNFAENRPMTEVSSLRPGFQLMFVIIWLKLELIIALKNLCKK